MGKNRLFLVRKTHRSNGIITCTTVNFSIRLIILNAQYQTKSHFLIRFFENFKIDIMLTSNKMFYILNIVCFRFSQSKLVKQFFVEYLSRLTKIRFHIVLIHMNLIFCKDITRKDVLVNLLYMKCFLIFICVYFLYCETQKIIYHNRRHYHYNLFEYEIGTCILPLSAYNSSVTKDHGF